MKEYTEDQLIDMLAAKMEDVNPLSISIDPEDEIRIYEIMSGIEGINEYYRALMGNDMKLHFMAKSDTERAAVRGAFGRVAWLRAKMKNIQKHIELLEGKKKRTAK